MTYAFDQFCADCRAALKQNPGEAAHEEVRSGEAPYVRRAESASAQDAGRRGRPRAALLEHCSFREVFRKPE
jgi:hypothetical protein